MDAVEIRPDPESFGRVARALDDEAGGEQYAADLSTALHEGLQPVLADVRGAVLGIATGGLRHAGESLRQAVAAELETNQLRTGARLRATKRGMPRGFHNAPKRLNARSWRHRVFGRGQWVQQTGELDWFDDTTDRHARRLHAIAAAALQDRARRITRRV